MADRVNVSRRHTQRFETFLGDHGLDGKERVCGSCVAARSHKDGDRDPMRRTHTLGSRKGDNRDVTEALGATGFPDRTKAGDRATPPTSVG